MGASQHDPLWRCSVTTFQWQSPFVCTVAAKA
jgi:hypothetical protein